MCILYNTPYVNRMRNHCSFVFGANLAKCRGREGYMKNVFFLILLTLWTVRTQICYLFCKLIVNINNAAFYRRDANYLYMYYHYYKGGGVLYEAVNYWRFIYLTRAIHPRCWAISLLFRKLFIPSPKLTKGVG